MDLWIALAAAGAGFVAKQRKNPLRDRESSSEFPSGDSRVVKPESRPSMGHRHDKSYPFQRLAQRNNLGEDDFMDKEQAARRASASDVASTSGFDGEKLVNVDNYEYQNVLSISTLSPVYLQTEDQAAAVGLRVNGNMVENSGDSFPEPSVTEMCTAYGYARNRISLRSRQSNMQFMKPLTSLESCLMAQLYKETSSASSPRARPFLVTDGKKIISRGDDSFGKQTEAGKNKLCKQIRPAENETVFGVPPLPYVGSLELRRMKDKTGKGLGRKLSSSSRMINGKHFHSLTGSSHGALLFGLGFSVGLISSFLANKREVDKLNDLLKQTENLVQDLQDELEMKDALTVKELAIEDYESQDTCDRSYNKSAPHSFSSQQNLDGSPKCGKELPDQKAGEDSESMSKIEAELEAELERLELNMNSSSLEGRLSDLVELDPDFIPEITRDELRPDVFGGQAGCQPCYADRDGSGTSTPHSANYAVSPHELTSRLNEVIQSRLEERVNELEMALEISQRKVRFMESERKRFGKEFSDQKAIEDRPVVINLSGEALDAYNEAYDEFLKMNESEEADLTSGGKENTLMLFDQNGEVTSYQPYDTTANGESSPALICHEVRTLEEHGLSGDVGFSGDESDDGHDEVEELLIKQIVEKTRKKRIVFSG